MRLARLLFVSLAMLLPACAAAHADTFNFSFGNSSDDISGSGTLTGNLTSPGTYTITGVTGTTEYFGTSQTIASIDPANSLIYGTTIDNLLFESSLGVFNFDYYGLGYSLSSGDQVKLYDSNLELATLGPALLFNSAPITISSAATPEPESFILLGTGLIGVMGAMRRRLRLA